MTHGVAGRIEAFEFDRLAHLNDIAGADTAIHIGYAIRCILVCNDFGTGRRDHRLVTADMIAMLMRVEYLGYRPAMFFGCREAFLVIEGIDSQRLTCFGACDQVIKVTVGVGGPDSFYDHLLVSRIRLLLIYVSLPRRYYRLPYRVARKIIVMESVRIRQLTACQPEQGSCE